MEKRSKKSGKLDGDLKAKKAEMRGKKRNQVEIKN